MAGNLNGKDVQARVITHNGRHRVAQLALMDGADAVIYAGNVVEVDGDRVTLIREPFGFVVASGVPLSFTMQTAEMAEMGVPFATKPAG